MTERWLVKVRGDSGLYRAIPRTEVKRRWLRWAWSAAEMGDDGQLLQMWGTAWTRKQALSEAVDAGIALEKCLEGEPV